MGQYIILCLYAEVESVCNTSLDSSLRVWVQHYRSHNTIEVTGAEFKFVAPGLDGRPRQVA